MTLTFLADMAVRDPAPVAGEPEIVRMITRSLDAMAAGGLYDQVGGGFHRYSVDDRWLVPHFEKMLYDQALLVRAYLRGWLLTRDERYRVVVEETIGYVLRDLATSARDSPPPKTLTRKASKASSTCGRPTRSRRCAARTLPPSSSTSA